MKKIYPWAALFAVLSIFLFHETVFEGKAFVGGYDRFKIEVPLLSMGADSLKQNQLPLWNSYIFSGTRGWGDPALRLLYPANLFIAKFFPQRLALATSWRIILECFLAALLAFLFFRKVWGDEILALFSSLTYTLSTCFLEQASHGVTLGAFVYFPLVMYWLWDWTSRSLAKNILALSLSMGLLLAAGFHQYSAYFLICASVISFARAKGAEALKQLTLLWAVSGILALLLNAVELLPMIEAQRLSNRIDKSFADIEKQWGQPWYMVFRLVFPYFLGDYATFPRIHSDADITPYEAFPAYAGAGAFFLGIIAVLRLKRAHIWPWVAAIFLITLCALKTPFMRLPYYLFGGVPLMHGRLVCLIPVCLAFLAPHGIAVFLGGKSLFQWLCAGLVFAVSLILFGLTSVFPQILPLSTFEIPFGSPDFISRFREAGMVMLAAGFSLALCMALRAQGALTEKRFKIVCLVLLAGELLFFSRMHGLRAQFIQESAWYPREGVAGFVAQLPDRSEYRYSFELGVPWSPSPIRRGSFRFNLNIPYGLADVNGYSNFINQRYAEMLNQGHELYRTASAHTILTAPLADLYAVKYFVAAPQAAQAVYASFAQVLLPSPESFVMMKPNALKRIRLACEIRRARDWREILDLAHEPGMDLSRTVFAPPEELFGTVTEQCPREFASRLEIRELKPGLFKALASGPTPSLAVVTETADPGWKAFIDGNPAKIHRVNYAFQAVEVPAGDHSVEFKFMPAGFQYGLAMTLAALAFLLGLAFWVWKPRLVP